MVTLKTIFQKLTRTSTFFSLGTQFEGWNSMSTFLHRWNALYKFYHASKNFAISLVWSLPVLLQKR